MPSGSTRWVPGPDLVGMGGLHAILSQLGLRTSLRCFVPQLQAHLIVKPAYSLLIHDPALSAKQNMHTAIPKAHACLANLFDPLF